MSGTSRPFCPSLRKRVGGSPTGKGIGPSTGPTSSPATDGCTRRSGGSWAAEVLMDVILDVMKPPDWDQVQAIYRQGIATGQATFETEAPSWEQWDASHHPFARLVARSGERIVGWAALSPVSRRHCYAGVAEVSVYLA